MGRLPGGRAAARSSIVKCLIAAALSIAAGGALAAADPQVAAFTDAPDPVPAGGTVTYTARIDNAGADPSLNTVLTVPIPAGATFVSTSPPAANCVYTAPNVVCTLGTIAPLGADIRNVDIVVRANGPGPTSVSLTATVGATEDINPGNNSQTETTTVITGADLALTKVDTPDPVAGGSNVTYTLTVANAGPNASAGIRIVDNLPPASVYVSSSGAGWTCGNAGQVVTCTRPGPHAVGASIPPVTIVARVTASSGSITNSATVAPFVVGGVPLVADPVTTNNTATADTAVVPGADVSITKTLASANPATAGTNVTFTLLPRNVGPAAAANAVVTDVLPANWVYVSATGANWSCGAVGQTVTCTRASLPTGATDNITLVATAPTEAQTPVNGQLFTNTGTIASSTPDPVSTNNSGQATVTVRRDGADLSVTKSKTPNPVAQGSPITSTIRVFNAGPRVATGPLRVVEQLAAGETYVSASGAGWTCAAVGQTVTCDHPNASGLVVSSTTSLPNLIINSLATASGTLSNTACSGSSVPGGSGATPRPPVEGDPNTGNDCASASTSSTVLQPDLAITKTTTTPTGGDKVVSATEDRVTYTLVVTNLSSSDSATGVRITDPVIGSMPAFLNGRTPTPTVGYVVSGGSTATFNCTVAAATGVVTCTQNGGALAPLGTVTVTITMLRPMSDGTFTNTATVTNTVQGDPNPTNNTASDTVTIEPIADVIMQGKTVTPNPVGAGQSATYIISYNNLGPSTAQNVVVTDTFAFPPGDSGVTVVSITATGGATCSITSGALLTQASPSFTCTRASLAYNTAGSITLVVRPNYLTGNPARTLPNTASITTTTAETTTGGDGGNNSRTASLSVQPATLDLIVNKTDFADPVGYTPGATFINYRVNVINSGPSLGTNVAAAESMQAPPGKNLRYVCDTTTYGGATCRSPSTCTMAPNTDSGPGGTLVFSCQVPPGSATEGALAGTLFGGQQKNIYLRFQVLDAPEPAGDVYRNSVAVSANETDTSPGNNTASEPTTVRQLIDLQTSKAASAATVALNQPFNWTVTVRNAGPANSLATEVTDTLPAGVEVTGAITWTKTAPVGNGTCSLAGSTVTCAMGPLNSAGNTATITIPARFTSFPASGSATNTATVNTDPTLTGAIDSNATNNTGTHAINVTRSSIAGLVFRDRDNNGLPGGAGETGIAAVAIALTGTDLYGNAITRNVTSAADGSYTFANLPPSNAAGYTLTQTQPAAYVNGVNPPLGSADSLGGTRPAAAQAGFGTVISAIPVGPAVTGINYTFAEVLRPSIGGVVFRDHNNNGVQNAGEAGIAGATVELRRSSDNSLVTTATTDGSGVYAFTAIEPGSYTLVELQPTGFLDGVPAPGQIGGVACGGCSVSTTHDPANEPASISRILDVNLSSGDSATLMNFGELVPSTVAGSVFVDFNNNGTRQAAEPGIVSNSLTLAGIDDRGNAVSRAITTDASGNYGVGNLRPANAAGYAIRQTQPAGFNNGLNPPVGQGDSLGGTRPASGPDFGVLIGAIPVAANQNGINYTFAEIGGASVSGLVWLDRNRDGTLQPTEAGRLAGVTVQLVDPLSGTVIATMTTAADGSYSFANAPIGNYRIVMLTPTGYGTSTPTTLNVTITPAGLANQNFGATAGSLAGQVFIDANNNGTPQAGDTPIAGNPIELLNASNAVIATTVTDGAGAWRFDDLPAATYTVRQPTQPPATTNGLTTAGTAGGTGTPLAVLPSAISAIALPLVNDATGYYFGELQFGSLAGSVYNDANNNGVRDPGETGFAGQQLVLTGTNDLGQTINTPAITDANGFYAFPNLRPGSYTIAQPNAPPGTLNGITSAGTAGGTATPVTVQPSTISAIALGAMVGGTNYNFGELTPSSFSGSVYNDVNNNGIREAGEAGFPGQTIVLTGTNDLGQAVNVSVVTDASGNYTFTNLRPGTYTLTQPNQPAGTGNGITTPGTAGGTATGVATTPSAISSVVLPSGTTASGYLFGERASGSIAGSVYVDANNNGVRETGETGIAGQSITLTGIDALGQPVNTSVVTDASGNYAFGALLGGTYTLTQPAQPAGTLPGRTTAGAGGGSATAPTVAPSAIASISLPGGGALTGYVFGELPPASLAGSVFNDLNNNGAREPAEPGFANQTIALSGTDDLGQAVTALAATDASGNYAFTNLRPGTYSLTQPNQPPGTSNGITTAGASGGTATPVATVPSAISSIALAPGAGGSGNLFGERAGGSIAGSVYVDANNNGVREPGEAGIAGQTIALTGTDALGAPVNQTTTTDAGGNYTFSALLGGTYTVTQPAQPANTLSGRTTAGSGAGSATTPAVTPSAISAITLSPSATLTGYVFGELPAARLAGSVFNDANNNGVRDAGEAGFANNTLTLTGTDDLGQPMNASVVTDANGDYVFANLRPGIVTVTQPTQPTGTLNGITTAGSLGGTATPVATLPSAISAITVPPGGQGINYLFAEIGNSPDIVAGKAAVGVFATGNNASYRITVANAGQSPTNAAYTVQDRLPAGMTLAASPSGSGWTCTGARGDTGFTCTTNAVLAPGATAPVITVPVSVAANAVASGNSVSLNNPVLAQGGGEFPAYAPTPTEVTNFNTNPAALPVCTAASTQNACRTPTLVQRSAALGGVVWYDTGTVPRQLDGGDQRLAGWTVEVLDAATATVVRTIVSGADGSWRAADLLPGTEYLVRFRDPSAGVTWGVPVSGNTGTPPAPCVTPNPGFTQRSSCIDTAEATQLRVVLLAGDELAQQSLPVDPAGVVYDALTRAAVPGAVVTLSPVGICAGFSPATHIANATLGGYTISGTSVSMTTGTLGAYQFLFALAAPSSCTFQLAVTPPSGYSFVSQVIAPQPGTFATPPGPGTTNIQPQAGPPPVGSPTTYYLQLNAGSGTQNVLNNHIPIDPASISGIVIVKTGSVQVVELGDSLQYTVRIRNTTSIALATAFIDDHLPAGFRYIPGTAQVARGGTLARIGDPAGSPGPNLTFAVGALPPNDDVVLTYRVRVGVGAMQGNGINSAQAKPTPTTSCAATPAQCSNISQFKVRVEGGVFTDEACVAGKVYVDCNGNRMQDDGEVGIPGVRLWLQNGTFFVTDSEGRYSYCGLRPMMHVLKVDRSTLPGGSQLVESSNRNLGDAGSLMLDIKKGELHRGDFIEGTCSAPVADETFARRSRGEVGGPAGAPGNAPTESRRPANGGTQQFRSSPPATPTKPQGGASVPR